METTIGRLLVNDVLPEDLRDYDRTIDKKTVKDLFTAIQQKHPDKYADISRKLHNLGGEVSTLYGREASLSPEAFETPPSVRKVQLELAEKVNGILRSGLSPEKRKAAIVEAVAARLDTVVGDGFREAAAAGNPLAVQVKSGSRGNEQQMMSILGGNLISTDHRQRPVGIPMLRSFADGLDSPQYWADTYSARRGELAKKFSTPEAGYLGKQLAMSTHRLVVTENDCGTDNGIPVDAEDLESEGALLARDAGSNKAGTILTPSLLKKMTGKIIVRSPLTCQAEHGICSRCAGVRERGMAKIGDNVGIAAAQALTEPLAQAQMNVRHGASGPAVGGTPKPDLRAIDRYVQAPKHFIGAAAVADLDGRIDDIRPAPQGGTLISIGGREHYVALGLKPRVAMGDTVEAGDVLSDGIPNPAVVIQHRGIGAGRMAMLDSFRNLLKEGGFASDRRNLEFLVRGLANHVRITDLDGPADTVPDDVVEYDSIVRGYEPRLGSRTVPTRSARGMYLEKPVLHYSIGTRITPKVAASLGEFGVNDVTAHVDPPAFEPRLTRAMENLAHSDDWMVRMGGLYGVKRSVLKAAQRGSTAEAHGTSYIAPLAEGVDFGRVPGKTY